MEFEGFDWDRGNREKCQKHGMTLADIESVFANPLVVLPDKDNPTGERRFRAIGRICGGRPAFIVFTMRFRVGQLIRPISARFMHRKEVEAYERAYPDV
jgi:hypothetical protein